jgi:hypothetical protein
MDNARIDDRRLGQGETAAAPSAALWKRGYVASMRPRLILMAATASVVAGSLSLSLGPSGEAPQPVAAVTVLAGTVVVVAAVLGGTIKICGCVSRGLLTTT